MLSFLRSTLRCFENTSLIGHTKKILTTWLSYHSLDHLNQGIQMEDGMSFYD